MTPAVGLALTAGAHARLKAHLFPGDGLEAAAILLCAQAPPPRVRLLVRDVLLVPYDECRRSRNALTWPGAWLERAYDIAEEQNLSLVLIHSHPGGLFQFSPVDNESDAAVMPGVRAAVPGPHGTAIMIPSGAIRARLYGSAGVQPVALVTVAGDDIAFWWNADTPTQRPLAFTGAMTAELGRLTAGFIGASGTGSVVGEQIGRLGFGRVVPIDFDKGEKRNLNRILSAGLADIGRLKVDIYADAVARYRGPGVVHPVPCSMASREAVLEASQCDVLFSCVDTLEARHIADLSAAAFLMPLFDVGVVIPTRMTSLGVAIADVAGRVDYVQPGGATLQDRGVYSPDKLRAEYLRRVAPDAHDIELAAGYIQGLVEEAPAVITLNMRAGSMCVSEFIARAYPFRHDPNQRFARTEFSIAAGEEEYFSEDSFSTGPNLILARGDTEPLLNLPALGLPAKVQAA